MSSSSSSYPIAQKAAGLVSAFAMVQPSYGAQLLAGGKPMRYAPLYALETPELSDTPLEGKQQPVPRPKVGEHAAPGEAPKFSLLPVAMGAILFIAIIAWFEVLRFLFDETFITEPDEDKYKATWLRLGYALFVTGVAGVLVLIMWRWYRSDITVM